MTLCPECGAMIEISVGTEEGEILECKDCGVELEVKKDNKLDLAPQTEEDWGE